MNYSDAISVINDELDRMLHEYMNKQYYDVFFKLMVMSATEKPNTVMFSKQADINKLLSLTYQIERNGAAFKITIDGVSVYYWVDRQLQYPQWIQNTNGQLSGSAWDNPITARNFLGCIGFFGPKTWLEWYDLVECHEVATTNQLMIMKLKQDFVL